MSAKPKSPAIRVHAASLGVFASSAAVREGRVEVVLVDAKGRRESYGRLVARRRVGSYLVQLADDVPHGMWWVLGIRVEPPRQVFMGFRHGRRVDAEQVFIHLTEEELDQGIGDQPS